MRIRKEYFVILLFMSFALFLDGCKDGESRKVSIDYESELPTPNNDKRYSCSIENFNDHPVVKKVIAEFSDIDEKIVYEYRGTGIGPTYKLSITSDESINTYKFFIVIQERSSYKYFVVKNDRRFGDIAEQKFYIIYRLMEDSCRRMTEMK